MSFLLEPDESPRKGILRVLRDQVAKALEVLQDTDRGEAVHEARKRFKKVRAVLRLAQDGMPPKAFRRANHRFRDAGRPLAEVRDAGVLLGTFDDLIGRYGDLGREDDLGAIRATLRAREDDAARRLLDDGKALDELASSIEEAGRALRSRAFDDVTWPALASGLKRTYGRGRRAARGAAESPTDENLHEWRKRVKDLWHAMELLAPIRPSFTRRRMNLAHRLADLLGDDHDLAVLRHTLANPPGWTVPQAVVEVVLPRIERRRSELQEEAFPLGTKVYRESPGAFVERVDRYRREWRSEAEASRSG